MELQLRSRRLSVLCSLGAKAEQMSRCFVPTEASMQNRGALKKARESSRRAEDCRWFGRISAKWRCLRHVLMWHWGTWFRGCGEDALIAGLHDLKGLFQPESFYDSVVLLQIQLYCIFPQTADVSQIIQIMWYPYLEIVHLRSFICCKAFIFFYSSLGLELPSSFRPLRDLPWPAFG